MTHPLTPREKVDVREIALAAMTEMRRSGESHEMCARWISERVNTALASGSGDQLSGNPGILKSGSGDHSGGVTDMIGSGDHAELAREIDRTSFWREARDAGGYVIDEPCDADDYGAEERPVYTEWVRKSVLALLAESAALRAAKWEVKHVGTMNDMVLMGMARDDAEARATEAERKLAEARAVIKDADQAARQGAAMEDAGYTVTVERLASHVYGITGNFLSKEAERG